jgi:hypothetical protein
MIARRRAGICTGVARVGGGGIIVRARLLLLARSDDGRLLARDATPLGRWRWGRFMLRFEEHFFVTLHRPSGNVTLAATAFTFGVLSSHDGLRR